MWFACCSHRRWWSRSGRTRSSPLVGYISTLANDADRMHPVLRRFLAYWVAAMSLPRAVALALAPISPAVFAFVAIAYTLEALVFEFEGTIGGSVSRTRARISAGVSLVLGAGAAWLALGRGY